MHPAYSLNRLSVSDFRLFESASVSTDADLVCFHGLNGAGKTSLLEAIHYLCLGKGYFSATDQQNIRFGSTFFRIEGNFSSTDAEHHVACTLEEGKRKVLTVDGTRYKRLHEHLSRFPAIVIAPDDISIVTGSPENRRQLMDNMLCQVNWEYAEQLAIYNRALRQRNAALSRFAETGTRDMALLRSYDAQLVSSGEQIHRWREQQLGPFIEMFERIHDEIAHHHERPHCVYRSELQESSIEEWLNRSTEADLATGRTLHGIHRDDLELTLNEKPIKRFGSQGQVKTMLVALKLASFRFLQEQLQKTPLLLLDDLSDKLDPSRAQALLDFATSEQTGQVFITETQPDRLELLKTNGGKTITFIEVKNGSVRYEG